MLCLLHFFLTACLPSQTVPEELQNGRGFGYVVAFRPYGTAIWMLTVLASADACRYVFRNESVRPFSPFEVKVGVFNNKGEGPFSPTTVVYSAEEGTYGSRRLRRDRSAILRGCFSDTDSMEHCTHQLKVHPDLRKVQCRKFRSLTTTCVLERHQVRCG